MFYKDTGQVKQGMNDNSLPLQYPPVEDLLVKAQNGDTAAREDLLEVSRHFILKTACRYSFKKLEWGRDDELSIALIAFNEAIDKYRQTIDEYKEKRKVPFVAFARQLIKYRLIDFFRYESRINKAGIKDGIQSIEEDRLAIEKHREEMAVRECQEEIAQYETLLAGYGLNLMELARVTPKRKSVRRNFIQVASLLAGEPMLCKSFIETKRLPLKELEQISGVPRKNLEKHRKYMVAISLIFCYPKEYTSLLSYLKD
jgi:RNA polymerase sigma factor